LEYLQNVWHAFYPDDLASQARYSPRQQQDLHLRIGAHHGVQEADPLISLGPNAGLLVEKPLKVKINYHIKKLTRIVIIFMDKFICARAWWQQKISAGLNVTYTQFRSSAPQYRHCLF
jgi:hypothetical protein